MTEFFDLILNGYLRIFVGLIIIGLIGFSLYFSLKNK
jgi:preprotein translocase subunit Sss1